MMEHKTIKITFRVTPTEMKVIEKKIEKTNIKMSQLARSAVLDKKIIIIEDLAVVAKELRAIGTNLNQLAILSHQGKITCLNIDNVQKQIDEIWTLLNSLILKTK